MQINGLFTKISDIRTFVFDLPTAQWLSKGTAVSSTNKTDHHDINEILLKVSLSTITLYIYGCFSLIYDILNIIGTSYCNHIKVKLS